MLYIIPDYINPLTIMYISYMGTSNSSLVGYLLAICIIVTVFSVCHLILKKTSLILHSYLQG